MKIRKVKKFFKKFNESSCKEYDIHIKDENVEDGNCITIDSGAVITKCRKFGVVFSSCGIDYLHIPYWKIGKIVPVIPYHE